VGALARAELEAGFSIGLGRLVIGDCLAVLRATPDDTFDLVITSPPYDGQPKYGKR
jgi:DNA modification methylase